MIITITFCLLSILLIQSFCFYYNFCNSFEGIFGLLNPPTILKNWVLTLLFYIEKNVPFLLLDLLHLFKNNKSENLLCFIKWSPHTLPIT